ncbi:histidine kinase [Micromonospora sp. NPDC047548]|uniref:sensor histidine kinase n=1 Tax=Micromonospora sp. NPDC047548 TaxID=3155624 RepID=UPI0033EAA11A
MQMTGPFRTARSTVLVVVGGVVGMLSGVVLLVAIALCLVLAVTVIGVPIAIALLFGTVGVLTAVQRSRLTGYGVQLTVQRRTAGRWWERARQPGPWRALCYHLLVVPLGFAGFLLVVGLWSAALGTVLLISFGWLLPPGSAYGIADYEPVGLTLACVGCVALIIVALVAARGLARLDIALAGSLLQTSRAEVLAQRVTALAESRADVVDAADAERRRIERDLHDGTQQRLVSLAMNLGMARASLTDTDPQARAAIEQAHDEAKQALAELRDLVRGLHPAVLDDRGLDAALSGIAARSPVPVRLRVSVPARPSRTIEAVAYFVVSEALANVAKHAQADWAEVQVARIGDVLHIAIIDTGRGGADPDAGTGLRGLARRTGSVDGTLRIESPVGGPTRIIVELPCES